MSAPATLAETDDVLTESGTTGANVLMAGQEPTVTNVREQKRNVFFLVFLKIR